jgi:hypothetical protein
MAAGLPAAPVEVTVTVPLYVPAVRVAAFTDTLIEDGTAPLAVAESQDAAPVEVVKAIPDVPVMLTGCAAGALPPIV